MAARGQDVRGAGWRYHPLVRLAVGANSCSLCPALEPPCQRAVCLPGRSTGCCRSVRAEHSCCLLPAPVLTLAAISPAGVFLLQEVQRHLQRQEVRAPTAASVARGSIDSFAIRCPALQPTAQRPLQPPSPGALPLCIAASLPFPAPLSPLPQHCDLLGPAGPSLLLRHTPRACYILV